MRQCRSSSRNAGVLPGPSLLQLMWLASPALPVGGFSYSEGLEATVECGLVSDEASATNWLVDQLHLSLGRADLAVVAKAIGAWRRRDWAHVRELNDWVLQTRETSELRLQSEQMGKSLLEWLRNHDTASKEDIQVCADLKPTYPVAFALAASATKASVRDALHAFAFGWAENMMSAAIKSVPLGQSAGQRILSGLANDIPEAVEQAMRISDSERQAFSPMLAILSAQHETQYSRLFRS
jgi:urease accessory protein